MVRRLVAGVGVAGPHSGAVLCGGAVDGSVGAEVAAQHLHERIFRWQATGAPGLDRYTVHIGAGQSDERYSDLPPWQLSNRTIIMLPADYP